MTRRRVGTLGLAALLLTAARAWPAAAEPAPACRASARLVPAQGHPGQQRVWQLEILRSEAVTHVAWIEPPAFPGFRVEWLPGQPERAGVVRDGVAWIARVEERALFPERAGEWQIAPRGLACELASGETVLAPISATRVSVTPLPAAGRPADFDGLVGAIALEVALAPRSLALGGSARLELTLRGDANLWDARDPLAGAAGLDGVELFAAPPRLALDPGPQLGVRRSFAWDVVPTREGRIALPELRVPYFDPASGRYAVASAASLSLEVGPRAAAPAPPRARAEPMEPEASHARALGWLGSAALLLLAAGGVLAWRRRSARGDVAGAALAAAARSDDPAVLARALRQALERELPGARSAAVEELHAPAGASRACEHALALLARVERSRFDPAAPVAPRAEVLAALEQLARR